MFKFTRYLPLLSFNLLIACNTVDSRLQADFVRERAPITWEDTLFAYDRSLVTIHEKDLFALDTELLNQLLQVNSTTSNKQNRLDRMLKIIFGRDQKSFPYSAGHSTVAAETWKNKYGDCISLTMLTYAASKVIHLPASMQEVRVTTLFDRREQMDFINEHVNLLVQNNSSIMIRDKNYYDVNVVIDFDPEEATYSHGQLLTEEGIAARFYNNLGAEYLAKNQFPLAYAYFKEAILIDPTYHSSYSNLAQLYKRKNLLNAAEKMLIYSLSIKEYSYIALSSLVDLMNQQNRTGEAKKYAGTLKRLQENTPYYWLSLGVHQIKNNQLDDAITSLIKASEMAQGFEEIHANLAIAYWRNHQPEKAREQLAILQSIHPDSVTTKLLGKKFHTSQ